MAPYLRIVAEIRERIRRGELRAGDRVPSTRGITQEWGVAMATATKVLAALRREGLVEARTGVGTVVVAEADAGTVDVVRAPGDSTARPAEQRRAREGDQGLTRERIVRAAVAVADSEGIATLSMRRVAAELGVAVMALYRHLSGKEELVTLMADAALGDVEYPETPAAHWRDALAELARLQWSAFKRHNWLAPALSITRPAPSPNALGYAEQVMRAMAGLPLDAGGKMHVHLLLFSYVRGIAFNFELEAQAEQESGITEEEWMDSQDHVLDDLLATGLAPAFGEVLAELGSQDGFDLSLDTLFEFGLARVLDGIGLLVASRSGEQPD